MSLIQNNVNRNLKTEWETLSKLSAEDKIEYINDETLYPLLFNDLSNHIYSIVKKFKDN